MGKRGGRNFKKPRKTDKVPTKFEDSFYRTKGSTGFLDVLKRPKELPQGTLSIYSPQNTTMAYKIKVYTPSRSKDLGKEGKFSVEGGVGVRHVDKASCQVLTFHLSLLMTPTPLLR